METSHPATGNRTTGDSQPRRSGDLGAGNHVVFFGKLVGSDCRRCGAYMTTSFGHNYCAQVTCPLALKEVKRRKRKRTSSLEKEYLPRLRGDDSGK